MPSFYCEVKLFFKEMFFYVPYKLRGFKAFFFFLYFIAERDKMEEGFKAHRIANRSKLLNLHQLVQVRRHRGHPLRTSGLIQCQDLCRYQGKERL